MQIFTLIPPETKIAILILVIISFAVVILRWTLHQKLQGINKKVSRLLSSGEIEGIQPPIVDRLRERYQTASKKLENVNTLALIDSVYKEERVRFLFFKLQCDQADGITRVFPNLLIAFGLIGTFWGITSNLTSVSNVVTSFSQTNPDISKLVQGLQSPLRDMGIAFSTSLLGLLAGSILTVINTTYSTSITKYQLIASLEDYLDNIYKPTVEGNTRLDTAIDRMVKQQQEFLTRFHENVGAALEKSFGKAANQIANECGRINKIAENIYINFSNAAGTISTGATTFQQAATSLESQTKNLADSLHEFKSGVETFKITANQIEQNNIVQNLDRVLVELNVNQQAFTNSTNILEHSLEDLISSNKIAAELAGKIYQSLDVSIAGMSNASTTIERSANIFSSAITSMETNSQTFASCVPEIQKSVKTFETAANKLEQNNIIQNLDRVLVKFNTTQTAFAHSTQTLQDSLVGIISSNETAAQLAKQVYKTWQDSTSQIVAASETIDAGAITFQQSASSLAGHTQTVMELMPQLKGGIDTFASAVNKIKANNIIKHLNTLVESLSITQSAFTRSTQNLAAGVDGIMSSHQQSTQSAEKVYQGLEKTVTSIQSGASIFVNAAQTIRDSSLAADLSHVVSKWQNAQNEFTNSTAIFSQAATSIHPVAAKLEPTIASLNLVVNSLQQVGLELVDLNVNTIRASKSTQTAIAGFDYNYQRVLNNTEASIQNISEINRSSWQKLIDILEYKIQSGGHQNAVSQVRHHN